MSRHGKAGLSLAAAAVVAFAIPALAIASPRPTLVGRVSNKPIATGTMIVGRGTNIALKETTFGTIECGILNLRASLKVNSDTEGFTASNFKELYPEQGNCFNRSGTVRVTAVTLSDFYSKVDGTVVVNVTFEVDVGKRTCTFNGTDLRASYFNGSTSLSFVNAGTHAGEFINGGACGEAFLTGTLALEAQTGEQFKTVY